MLFHGLGQLLNVDDSLMSCSFKDHEGQLAHRVSCIAGIQQKHVHMHAKLQLLEAADDTQSKDTSAVDSP